MRYLIVLLLFLSFLILPTAHCKQLKLVTMEFPPYVYSEKQQVVGFNVDLLKAIFAKMRMEIDIELMPWPRAIQYIKDGQADAIFPFFKTEQRVLFADYSDQFTTEDTALFVHKDSKIQWHGDLLELSSYSFGRVRGYSSGWQLDELVKSGGIKLDEAGSSQHNVKKLLAKRFDIMIEAQYVALHELKMAGGSEQVKMLDIIKENPSYLAFSKKKNHAALITNFNQILEQMKASGEYQGIVDNFFADYF